LFRWNISRCGYKCFKTLRCLANFWFPLLRAWNRLSHIGLPKRKQL